VKASDFHNPAHRTIYEVMAELDDEDQPVDPITVAAALSSSGELDRAGGAGYLQTLQASVPKAANAAHYGRIVKERAVQRRLIAAGTRITQIGYNPSDGDVNEMIDLAEEVIRDVAAQRVSSQRSSALATLLQSALDEIEEVGTGSMSGVPTGFTDLDRLLNGLRPGHLIVVAGAPGVGKSTLVSDFARAASIKHALASAIFSMEMGKNEIVMRLLAAEARVPLHVLRSGQLSDDDWTKLARHMTKIADAPLFIDDTRTFSRWDLWQEAVRLKRHHDLRLLVVDSPLAFRAPDAYEVIRDLKLLARQIDCPVVVVSQLQSGYTPGRLPPTLDDLDETLTQIADVVVLLHREDLRDYESPRAGEADLIVAKQRNGPTDTVTVAAQVHLARFVDMAIP
jgi:replicative DNA helicase